MQLKLINLLSTSILAVVICSSTAVLVAKAPTAPPGQRATSTDVVKLHHNMETIAAGLESMLKPGHYGSLAKAKVAPAIQAFVAELRVTLNATVSPKGEKAVKAAMRQLRNAQAGMLVLTKALTSQQETLMHADASEATNLLLGVLMVRRNTSMDQQLEVLKTPDFSSLPVSKALLAKHDEKMPLFQQVSMYLDIHRVSFNASSADEQAQKLAHSLAYFEKQVAKMEHEEQAMQQAHANSDKRMEVLMKKSHDNVSIHRLRADNKHLDRDFKKRMAIHKQQTVVMKDVVSALKRGDSRALKNAQDALQAHLRAMKEKTGNFLYLVQLGHRLAKRDCPFCVAQCIGRCHDGGSPYSKCMTQCAEAGH